MADNPWSPRMERLETALCRALEKHLSQRLSEEEGGVLLLALLEAAQPIVEGAPAPPPDLKAMERRARAQLDLYSGQLSVWAQIVVGLAHDVLFLIEERGSALRALDESAPEVSAIVLRVAADKRWKENGAWPAERQAEADREALIERLLMLAMTAHLLRSERDDAQKWLQLACSEPDVIPRQRRETEALRAMLVRVTDGLERAVVYRLDDPEDLKQQTDLIAEARALMEAPGA